MILALLAILLLQKYGRKQLLLIGLAFLAFSLLNFSIGLIFRKKWITVAPIIIIGSSLLYFIAFVLTLGPIMWLYIPEIIQPNRVSYAVMSNWFTNSSIMVLFPIIRSHCGDIDCPIVFIVFCVSMVICFVTCKIFMVETKGRTEL